MKTLKILLAIVAVWSGFNSAFGQIWSSNNVGHICYSSGVSADGTIMISAGGDGGAYISTNSGSTWMNTPQLIFGGYVSAVASSATGNPLYVQGPKFSVSTNFGTTWDFLTNAPNNMAFFGTSADGIKIAGIGYQGNSSEYASTNAGATWVTNNITGPAGIEASADGSRLIMASGNGKIYTSTNSGFNWKANISVPAGSVATWTSVASSANGSRLAAVTKSGYYGGYIFQSMDAGATWTSNNTAAVTAGWNSVAMSADGSTLLVSGYAFTGNIIYASTNFGMSWVSNRIPVGSQICSSVVTADGKKLESFTGGVMWVSRNASQPQLYLTPSPTNFALSWLIPSTNFVLQQSSDLISWSSVTNTPTLNLTNLNNELSISPTNDIGFYRLSTP